MQDDVGRRMIGPWFRRQIEVGGQEGRAEFGNELLHGIAFIPETLPPEFTARRGAAGMEAATSQVQAEITYRLSALDETTIFRRELTYWTCRL